MIKEIIVVEGKDDISAVKAAVNAEVLATNGFGYKKDFIQLLKKLSKTRGIIILTDPDFAGEQIRKDLASKIDNCKHGFLPQGKAFKKGDIGIENATKEDIRIAIEKARPIKIVEKIIFTKEDMLNHGLMGAVDSRDRRDRLGDILGIGYANSKQFLNRLNNFGISKEEFTRAIERMNMNGAK